MNWTGPMCRCGSRNTQRVGNSALQRLCLECGNTYAYRVCDGKVVPLAIETALALDEQRK